MPSHRGFIYVADPGMAHVQIGHADDGLPFTDAVRALDHSAGERTLGLLSFDKLRVRFSDYVKLRPMAISHLIRTVPPNVRGQAISAFRVGGQSVPPATWRAIWDLVKGTRPEAREQLERLERMAEHTRMYHSDGDQNARLEVDTVALSLAIFGIHHSRLLESWEPHEGAAAFLSGLQEITLPEDAIIVHDSLVLPGWETLGRLATGVVTFERRGQLLQVMNVHRTRLENVLGIDLLYFHHVFGSYVFVQYKRMSRSTGGSGSPIFRPSGRQYEAELARMHAADLATHGEGPIVQCEDYRLWGHAFFLKLCPPSLENTPPDHLIRGMYFPLDYWDTLVDSPSAKGSAGGTIITYDNAQRWISNSLFINLVQYGWVGSASVSSSMLRWICEESLDSGRSLTVALTAQA
jgi:hypothetical protein